MPSHILGDRSLTPLMLQGGIIPCKLSGRFQLPPIHNPNSHRLDYCTPASKLDTERSAACLSNTLYTFIPRWLPGPLGVCRGLLWAPLSSLGLPWDPGPLVPPDSWRSWIPGRVPWTLVWVLWTLGLPGPVAAWTLGWVPWAPLGSPFPGSRYMSERVCIPSAQGLLQTSF